jgi:hypothetical protein
MNEFLKTRIDHNHALASALQMLIAFAERPDYLGGPLGLHQAIEELVRQGGYGVTVEEMFAELRRIECA